MCAKDNNEVNKIGAKVLSEKELGIMIPNYMNIDNQIRTIQEMAKKNKAIKQSEGMDIEFSKQYNNVFSILGERGSGKTSILLSLKYYLMKSKELSSEGNQYHLFKNVKKNATFLPIVIPQDMDEDSDSLGWIIGFFRKYANEANDTINQDKSKYKEFRNDCTYRKESQSKVLDKYEELTKTYILRKEEFRKKILTNNYTGTIDYIKSNTETLNLDISLTTRFNEFIDKYIEFKRIDNKEDEPLIFLFFDDVDLSNRKCLDVLETIMRYLCHSNIVVFIAGEYNAFKESLTIEFLRRDNILDGKMMMNNYISEIDEAKLKNRKLVFDSNDKNIENEENSNEIALNIRKNLAYDYLKKVLSPALRFELPKLNDIQKTEFGTDSKELIDLLEEKLDFKTDKETQNFLRYGKMPEHNIIYSYFSIFDSKPRGLTNVYYYLENTAQIDLGEFVDVIINSDYELQKSGNKIRRVLMLDKGERIEIKYDLIPRLFESDCQLQKRVLMLCLFAGNIHNIKVESKLNLYTKELKETAMKIFSENLKNIKADFRLLPNIQNISEDNFKYSLKLYEELDNFNKFEGMFSLVEYLNIIQKLEKKEEQEIVIALENCYKKDQIWVKSIISKIFVEEKTQINIELRDECINQFYYISQNSKLRTKVNNKLLAIEEIESFKRSVTNHNKENLNIKENIEENIEESIQYIRQRNIILKIVEDFENAMLNRAEISIPIKSLVDELRGDKNTGLIEKHMIFKDIKVSNYGYIIEQIIDLYDNYESDLKKHNYKIEADDLIFLLRQMEMELENEDIDEVDEYDWNRSDKLKNILKNIREKLNVLEEKYNANLITEENYRKNVKKIVGSIINNDLIRVFYENDKYDFYSVKDVIVDIVEMYEKHNYIIDDDLENIEHQISIIKADLEEIETLEHLYMNKYSLLVMQKRMLQDEIEYDIQKIVDEHQNLKGNASILTNRTINLIMKKYELLDRMPPRQRLVEYVGKLNLLKEIVPQFNDEYEQIDRELNRCRELEYENQSVLEEIYNEEIAELMKILYLYKLPDAANEKKNDEKNIQAIRDLNSYIQRSRLRLYIKQLMSDN